MPETKRGSRRALSLKPNDRNKVNGIDLLAALKPESAKLVFFDPQYRGIFDKQKYGNEGTRQKRRSALPQMTDDDITDFITGIVRALKPSGHLVLWGDKFSISTGRHLLWWQRHLGTLHQVDMITWNRIAPGMGRRTRGYCEFALVFQKEPKRAKGIWIDRGIMDCWPESSDRSLHPHAKPTQLIYRLIRCVTKTGDLVVDPAAGAYGVLDACRLTGREFMGGDLI